MSMGTQKGFTLIELSIVIAIIGLLVGGVFVGTNMINSAKLNGIITDITKYKNATANFRDKYYAYPGDMIDATSYWSAASNGNGDGQVGPYGVGAQLQERFGFWEQLALAGMIDGNYTGASTGTGDGMERGINIPPAPFNETGYHVSYTPRYASNSGIFWAGPRQLSMTFGMDEASTGLTTIQAISSEGAKSIDDKIDDGLPGLGLLRSNRTDTLCNTNTTNQNTAGYNLTERTQQSCALYINIDN